MIALLPILLGFTYRFWVVLVSEFVCCLFIADFASCCLIVFDDGIVIVLISFYYFSGCFYY